MLLTGVLDAGFFASGRIALDRPAASSVNCLSGEVWDIGYLGDVSIYHVRLPTGATVKATVTIAILSVYPHVLMKIRMMIIDTTIHYGNGNPFAFGKLPRARRLYHLEMPVVWLLT